MKTMFQTFEWSPRTQNQSLLRLLIKEKVITFAIGPAGTGKTFVALGTALELYRKNTINGIVVTRPLVPVGQNFGHLPGTIDEKIAPYMFPIVDLLKDFGAQSLIDGPVSIIEYCALELMRGRTFHNKLVIVDEAQNTTTKQIEMAMTRLGDGSKMVICGDIHQTDLKGTNGLSVAAGLFFQEEEFGLVKFGIEDIQRQGITKIITEKFYSYYQVKG